MDTPKSKSIFKKCKYGKKLTSGHATADGVKWEASQAAGRALLHAPETVSRALHSLVPPPELPGTEKPGPDQLYFKLVSS